MKFSALVRSLVFASLMTLGGASVAQQGAAETTTDDLQLVEGTRLARVYAQEGAGLAQYNRIYLTDAYISFKKNWTQDKTASNGIGADDMARIKIELSTLFRDVFSKTLEEGGYELTDVRADDVLLIKPAIVNLDFVSSKQTPGNNTHVFAETAGEITLYLEFYDSLTDDLIAKAFDRQTDRQTGYFQWQNRLSNRAAAHRILQVWADVLKRGLDEARGVR